MFRSRVLAVALLSLVVVGCSGSSPEDGGAASPKSPASAPSGQASVGGGTAHGSRGSIVFMQCRSCHMLEDAEEHSTGPNLAGLFGATAGTKEGYPFSGAFARSEVVWSLETLDAFLQEPHNYIPGNKMAFAGVMKESDRLAVIEFLKSETL